MCCPRYNAWEDPPDPDKKLEYLKAVLKRMTMELDTDRAAYKPFDADFPNFDEL